MSRNIYTDRNQMEIKLHGTVDFPFCIGKESILEYDNKRFNCHWHKEIELALVYEGRMMYKVNEKKYVIAAGDCLFINSNALHLGWSMDNQPCVYRAITMDPSILGNGNYGCWTKYVEPITECTSSLASFLFRDDRGWQSLVLSGMREIDALYQEKDDCYEILIVSELMKIWSIFYKNIKNNLWQQNIPDKELSKIKSILDFMHQHYSEKISLDDIAHAAHISKSECSHFFKRYMRETPFEYLLRYRIKKSLPILLDQDQNITETALAVGFSNASYYTEIFRRFMGTSPKEYTKQTDRGCFR